MQRHAFIAHVEALATAVVGALVGAGTTLVGQGVPDLHTQGTVGAVFGAFCWLVAIGHRWKTSPLDVEQLARSGGQDFLHALLPLVGRFLEHVAAGQANSASSSSAADAGKGVGP